MRADDGRGAGAAARPVSFLRRMAPRRQKFFFFQRCGCATTTPDRQTHRLVWHWHRRISQPLHPGPLFFPTVLLPVRRAAGGDGRWPGARMHAGTWGEQVVTARRGEPRRRRPATASAGASASFCHRRSLPAHDAAARPLCMHAAHRRSRSPAASFSFSFGPRAATRRGQLRGGRRSAAPDAGRRAGWRSWAV